uniref:AlNc14C52G4076 protein n=1 Tax=Albugo laibachii Nc14 TaxID=890382 RepID=F0WBN2_9STRA|nr:AlNc14C52G4076 [Albugo laibachii Nc14]|eukprot:CCA18559.1 AlNc14C52G4076 [Albugo laibachii Nc14]
MSRPAFRNPDDIQVQTDSTNVRSVKIRTWHKVPSIGKSHCEVTRNSTEGFRGGAPVFDFIQGDTSSPSDKPTPSSWIGYG